MQLRDCALLLPSYELDGYPRSLPSPEADQLLSGWVALWHPQFMITRQSIPRWHQVENPPAQLEGGLLILPPASVELMPSDLESRVEKAGGLLIRSRAPWREFQQELLVRVGPAADLGGTQASGAGWPPDLLHEFAALGFAYLQIQLMTRQLRYTSNLDVPLFTEHALQAAQAAADGDWEKSRGMLQTCFDSLGQERDHYYSLDVNLLDMTLLASSTLGKSLERQLSLEEPTAYLASSSLLRELSSRHPATAQQLRQACADRSACIVGGLDRERPHPLMTREALAREILRGRQAYGASLPQSPTVFARLSYGLLPDSAAMLRRFGFTGALLEAFSGGSYPTGNQAKISWEASDGTFISAISGSVLDAADPASFLSIGWTIGEALDHQHVPTAVFAHWPGRGCDYYDLLRIIARRTPALGKWLLADDYFQDTDQPYHQERLAASGFQNNWLVNADSAGDLLLATKEYHRLHVQIRSLQNLCNLAWQLEHFHPSKEAASTDAERAEAAAGTEATPEAVALSTTDETLNPQALPMNAWAPELEQICESTDSLLDDSAKSAAISRQTQAEIDALRPLVLERLAKKLSRRAKAAGGLPAKLLINPTSCPVRVQTHMAADEHLNRQAAWHFADGRAGEDRVACVDVPSLGFIAAGIHTESTATSREPPLADAGGMLQNEFLEAQIDTARGHLRSLHVPARRGNRLSFLVARRTRDSKGEHAYSEMTASQVRMLTSSNVSGLVRAGGVLEANGKQVGKFEIDYQVWRGNRILEIIIRLSELKPLEDDNPWRAAYIARLAWPSEAASVRSHSCGSRYAWAGGKAIAPTLIDIDETDFHTHYLTGGLAFHRRTDTRFLETILAVDGQTEVEHRIGIGVDLPHPTLSASQFIDQKYEYPVQLQAGQQIDSSGWLATANVKNVDVALEAPLVDEQQRLVGLRLFLTETDGKSTNATIRLFREIASASRVDYLGGKVGQLTAKDDQITIALRSNEQVNVDLMWRS